MNKKVFAVALLVMLVFTLGNPYYAAMASQSTATGPTTKTINSTEASAAGAMNYWTPAARAAAKPLPARKLSSKPATSAPAPSVSGAAAAPGMVPGAAPAASANDIARQDFPAEWAQVDAAAQSEIAPDLAAVEPTGSSGVYTSYIANFYPQLYTYYPYKAVGKLYFRDYLGYSYYCSASVVSPANVIVTAGHCVYDTDTNHWQNSWVFVPAERNGVAIYGTFAYTSATVLYNWMTAPYYSAGIQYDMAVIKLRTNSAGRSVTSYTGYLGRSWNYGYTMNLTEISYPANRYLGSKYTYIGQAETFAYSTDILAYGSNLGSGASGSPILYKYSPYTTGAVNFVNAVQSGSSPSASSPVFDVGARFTSYNIVTLCNAAGC